MTTVLMQKPGEEDILVDSTNVIPHEALGWRRAKIAISADGQSLIVPRGTYIDVQSGALKLDGVQMVSSAAELNSLDLNEDLRQMVHYGITPDAVSVSAVLAATNLAAAGQNVTAGITNPDVPRTVTVKGNVSGITGNVVVTGTNILDAAITDTIALNGTSEVEGVKAFKTVTQVALPARTHTPVAQVETATVVGTITGSGNAAVIVPSSGIVTDDSAKSSKRKASNSSSARSTSSISRTTGRGPWCSIAFNSGRATRYSAVNRSSESSGFPDASAARMPSSCRE